MRDRGGRGLGSGSSPATPWWVVAWTRANAPPGSSISRAVRATRGCSTQWNDWAKVISRNEPSPPGNFSARMCRKRRFVAELAPQAVIEGGSSPLGPGLALRPARSAWALAAQVRGLLAGKEPVTDLPGRGPLRAPDGRALRPAVRDARRRRRPGPGDHHHRLLARPGETLDPGAMSPVPVTSERYSRPFRPLTEAPAASQAGPGSQSTRSAGGLRKTTPRAAAGGARASRKPGSVGRRVRIAATP